MNAQSRKFAFAAAAMLGPVLAGCATAPYGDDGRYDSGYQGRQDSYGHREIRCRNCGVVQEVQQVYIRSGSGNGGTIGAVIGAVAGGVLGHQVGKGDGRTAATVAGAVAGGAVGHQIGKRNEGDETAWRIVVRLDDGQYVTVTQRDNPGVRSGDFVEVRGNQVYAR
ncbi:MAG TPA: glycine zipper 2TM domain-containing protein [Rhodanobacter sp.]|nr:glycine zipper 2TM domain-containing protein [Rhodanobacter sp.]